MNEDQYYQEKAAYDLLEKYKDISKKLMVIFWIMILANIFSLIELGLTVVSFVLQSNSMAENVELVFIGLNGLMGLAVGIIVFTMREYDDQFGTAGICYIVCQVCTIGGNIADTALGSNNCIGLILKLVAGVLGIIYIINYTKSISAITFNVSSSLANNWDTLRKAYLGGIATMVVSSFLLIIPFINILAFLALMAASIAMIVVSVWQIVITFMTSRALDKYELN